MATKSPKEKAAIKANAAATKKPRITPEADRLVFTDEVLAALPTDEEARELKRRDKIRDAKLGTKRSEETTAKITATKAAKSPEEKAARIAKQLATLMNTIVAQPPEEKAARIAKKLATDAAKSPEEKAAIKAKKLATDAAKSPEEKAKYATARSKRIKTPDGIFDSATLAAKHYGVSNSTILSWTKSKPKQFKYLPKKPKK